MSFTFPIFITIALFVSLFEPEHLVSLKAYIPIFLGLVMFGMGLTITFDQIKKVFLNPKWVITGLLLQFTIMPTAAFFLAKLFSFSEELLIGFVVLGCCPGGTASNVIAYLSKANIPLSISLTIASTFLSVFLTPLLIYALIKQTVDLNILDLIKSTFWIVIFPLVDGIILRRIFLKKVNLLISFFPKFSEFIIALIIGIIFSVSSDLFKEVTMPFLLAIFIHNLIGLSLGYYFSQFFRFPDDVKKTISIEVGMQNSGLGMTLALIHFGKLASLPSAIFSLWHNLAGLFLIYLWKKK
tara:strand:+ start:1043 stop:1933 length:891 start_codon:yes stop_codon:yes gene_type:complete